VMRARDWRCTSASTSPPPHPTPPHPTTTTIHNLNDAAAATGFAGTISTFHLIERMIGWR
jgi:hypothetical protein